ncbi:hypothetical protein GGS20DRAFT_586877 [Poronia punctata]|nr:hypothetical protein GGS20DRAFT_586877 [Poronia punctata]
MPTLTADYLATKQMTAASERFRKPEGYAKPRVDAYEDLLWPSVVTYRPLASAHKGDQYHLRSMFSFIVRTLNNAFLLHKSLCVKCSCRYIVLEAASFSSHIGGNDFHIKVYAGRVSEFLFPPTPGYNHQNTNVRRKEKTVESFQLVRLPWCYYDPAFEADFMEPYIGPVNAERWKSHTIMEQGEGPATEVEKLHKHLCLYAVCPGAQAYVVSSVFLAHGTYPYAERRTAMKHRDLVVDNYIHDGGDLKTWRWMGINTIFNAAVRQAVKKTFAERSMDWARKGVVEFSPQDQAAEKLVECNRSNEFVRSVESLLAKYGEDMGHAKVKRYIFISSGIPEWAFEGICFPPVHMVVEFCRPGEDGYGKYPTSL